ncbi:fumarylacetoacetase [soil metagenome]
MSNFETTDNVTDKVNGTHDAALRSWVTSANETGTDFPIQNLPFAVFRDRWSRGEFRIGVAIGDQILDLRAVSAAGLLGHAKHHADLLTGVCSEPDLTGLMKAGADSWTALRSALSTLLREGSASADVMTAMLIPQANAEFGMPTRVGDFTDFFASVHHARRTGALSRPDNPLLPNYHWVPIAYHGRSSSIRVSGCDVKRPSGQVKLPADAAPTFRKSARLDYESELGFFVGPGNALGEPIALDDAGRHIFGVCLLNDWSARDIQGWEAQPLGPFLAKNFATVISPWIATWEALQPFRTEWKRDVPAPLSYLDSASNTARGALDIGLGVWIETARMRQVGTGLERLSRTNAVHSHWTLAQMLTHHSSNGCNLMPGDLIGTGTQSGPTLEEAGCMLELSEGGKRAIVLKNAEERRFLEDGDRVVLTGRCERSGARSIGFGECSGLVTP